MYQIIEQTSKSKKQLKMEIIIDKKIYNIKNRYSRLTEWDDLLVWNILIFIHLPTWNLFDIFETISSERLIISDYSVQTYLSYRLSLNYLGLLNTTSNYFRLSNITSYYFWAFKITSYFLRLPKIFLNLLCSCKELRLPYTSP